MHTKYVIGINLTAGRYVCILCQMFFPGLSGLAQSTNSATPKLRGLLRLVGWRADEECAVTSEGFDPATVVYGASGVTDQCDHRCDGSANRQALTSLSLHVSLHSAEKVRESYLHRLFGCYSLWK